VGTDAAVSLDKFNFVVAEVVVDLMEDPYFEEIDDDVVVVETPAMLIRAGLFMGGTHARTILAPRTTKRIRLILREITKPGAPAARDQECSREKFRSNKISFFADKPLVWINY
jgi:hypothetical protein